MTCAACATWLWNWTSGQQRRQRVAKTKTHQGQMTSVMIMKMHKWALEALETVESQTCKARGKISHSHATAVANKGSLVKKKEDNKNDNMSRTNLSIKMSQIFPTIHSLEDHQFAIKWGHHRYNQAPTQLVLKESKLTHFNDLWLQAWCHFYRMSMSINIFCLHYKRH